MIAGSALFLALERFPIVVWAGAALLGWIAGELIAADPVMAAYLAAEWRRGPETVARAAAAGAVLVLTRAGWDAPAECAEIAHSAKPR